MRILFPYLTLALAAGCLRNITEGGADVQILRSVVYGRVSAQTGAGVSGVLIELRPDPNGGCPAQEEHSPNVATSQTLTNVDGEFRAELVLGVGEGTSSETTCTRLDITPASSSGLKDTSVSVGPMQFTSAVSDSVHADIVLRPR